MLHDHNYAIQEENVSERIDRDRMGSGDTHSETGGPARLLAQVAEIEIVYGERNNISYLAG